MHANAATSSTTSVGGGSGAGTGPSGSLGGSTAPRPAPGSSGHSGTKFRHGLLQLMIHTIDPLHDVSRYDLLYKLKESHKENALVVTAKLFFN
ncbi:hypothetical protein RUM43_004251 [Polyplax serrata]|uniref:Uncharacterized protein n=1 Tax=Polyplax serrata TaxID=468196 RepID=A0AAN8SBF4_POLSC